MLYSEEIDRIELVATFIGITNPRAGDHSDADGYGEDGNGLPIF